MWKSTTVNGRVANKARRKCKAALPGGFAPNVPPAVGAREDPPPTIFTLPYRQPICHFTMD
eukprot:CAMPEP_0172755030 /NCGR_PEP_ID=MMETSP1074-20121228/159150_1 /TAXON_ID=2916 /ORGANISM="Ceratium fusus, Strain PA161109" /LENGTH=60 /DNA_ID=CAMNT_0013588065 /DNA_START=158 /DNA_END=340 /DNA_ORIENTATION=+